MRAFALGAVPSASPLRDLAEEFGFWPATTDPEDIERHRRHNRNADYWLARSRRFDHLRKN